jgi:RNA-binding protein 25
VVEGKMRPWVIKKIMEYLGEEEKTLVDFILSKIAGHKPPTEILDQLSLVLDEEAEGFVIKLWRALIFEMLSLQTKENKDSS